MAERKTEKVCIRCRLTFPATEEFFKPKPGRTRFQFFCRTCADIPRVFVVTNHLKTCTGCKETKPNTLEFFGATKVGDGLRTKCRPCILAVRQIHNKKPEVLFRKAKQRRAWAKNNPRATHGYDLKKDFNITIDEYEAMLEEQAGGCAMCEAKPETLVRRLAVDHDHETGEIRGLLCSACNLGLGKLGDNIDVAISILITYKELQKSRKRILTIAA